MNACTIIARNYLAHARVLARSFLEHHPDGQFTTLVIDAEHPFPTEPGDQFDVLVPTQIGLDERELNRLAMLYDLMEFATALKPSLLRTLLARGAESVTYFDPDIEIFAPLEDIDELVREHSIVLTPHTLSPLPHDRREPGERTLLLAGMFNLGFISVSREAGPFLDWWQERVARAGFVDPGHGEFVDQRWVDFVPSLFEHTVLRDPTVNVAHWNLESRRLTVGHDGYLVDGQPLRFFHFSGFDPDKAYLLSKFLGPEPRILLSGHPVLSRLCATYAEKLFAAGYREASAETYGFGALRNGIPITKTMRWLYRKALDKAEKQGGAEPPNPFAKNGLRPFMEWLNEPVHPRCPTLTRYLAELHAGRADLQEQFPDPRWADAEPFLEWAWASVRSDEGLPAELVPDLDPVTTPDSPLVGGVNVAGYFRAEAGVGQAARHVLAGLSRADIPFTSVVYGETPARQAHAFEETGEATYDTNIVCVNADQLPRFAYDVGPDFFRSRYSIGLWWWEVSLFPSRFDDAFEIVDEIWVGSDFVRDAISAETGKPVFTLPLGIEVPEDTPAFDRASLGIPPGFMFLFSFDFDGRFERKNPMGAVKAFTKAFDPGEGPILVVKSLNGDRWLTKLEELRAAAAGRPDVVIIDRYLSAAESSALTAGCDCYVSLHRSEGFGLTIAEAMAHGKPVIATAYSGNLEYMTEDTSFFVPYGLTPIPRGIDPYPAGGEWAEPDLGAAADLMRRVHDQPEDAASVGRRAREHIAKQLSPERAGEFMRGRLEEVWRLPASARVSERGETRPSGILQVERYLSEGPSVPIQSASRFGPLGRFARRLVYRAIRPYTMRHSELDHSMLEALYDLSARTDRAESNAVGTRVRLERFLETFDRRLQETGTSIEGVERRQLTLAEQVGAIERETTATPFMSNPGEFLTRNGDGDQVLGYSGLDEGAAGESLYRQFENVFRGPEQLVSDRQRVYVGVVANHEPVLDVGCGRGEFLDLLHAEGIDGRGLDIDGDMVAHCRAKGHQVELAEATEYLERRPDGEFGAIFSAHVIEHMEYEKLLRFLALARAKLADGGVFVVETVNPHSVPALKTFWVDLTHEKPIFPEVALALCRLHGFESAHVIFPNGTDDLDRDRREQGEYAVIARAASLQTTATKPGVR